MEEHLRQLTAMAVRFAPKVALAVLTLFVGMRLINWASAMLRRAMSRRQIDESVQPFLISLVSTGLKIMLLLSVAGMFGIETTSFIAIFSALAFSVGMALQGSLGHFASGVLILVFKPYRVGDAVTIANQTGDVEEIGVFNTTLKTDDNRRIFVPNGQVTSAVITNFSGQGIVRLDLAFTVGNQISVEKARAAAQKALADCPFLDPSREAKIVVTDLRDDRFTLGVRPWIKPEDQNAARYFLLERMKTAFENDGINGPINQIQVTQSA